MSRRTRILTVQAALVTLLVVAIYLWLLQPESGGPLRAISTPANNNPIHAGPNNPGQPNGGGPHGRGPGGGPGQHGPGKHGAGQHGAGHGPAGGGGAGGATGGAPSGTVLVSQPPSEGGSNPTSPDRAQYADTATDLETKTGTEGKTPLFGP